MSTPALKPLPAARRITTRTRGSSPRLRTVSASSNHPATVSALTGGLSITTSAMPSPSTAKRLGGVDVLVNNAGGSPPADSATASPKFSNAIISLNLVAPLVFAQKANAVMQQQAEGGVVINIASLSGLRPSPGTAAYGAAKAGLLNLTQTLAMDYAPKVRVNAVTAGLVKTEQSHLFYGDDDGIAAVGA